MGKPMGSQRGSHSMSIINRGPNRWELRVYIGKDEKGHSMRRCKRVKAKSRRAAEKALRKFTAEVSMEKNCKQSTPMTFEYFAKVWDENHNQNLAMMTAVHQRQLLKGRIMDYFKGKCIQEITADDIRYFLDELRHEKLENGQLLSATMVYKNFKLLRHILGKAVEWHVISQNPCDELCPQEVPKPEYHHYPILQRWELQRLLKAVDATPDSYTGIKHKLMFYITLLTGVRKGELCALTWDCVDWEHATISVDKSEKYVSAKVTEVSKPKTKSSIRHVYVDNKILKLMHEYRELQRLMLSRKSYTNPGHFIFLATRLRHGEVVPMSPNAFNSWLTKLCRVNELPHITVHSLRHMAATYSLNNGASLTTVQAMLGHTNIRTTSIYLHPLEVDRKQAAEKLSQNIADMIAE